MMRKLALLLVAAIGGAHGETKTYDWVVSREWQKPDGFWRPTLAVNKAPVGHGDIKIRVKNGDRVIVNVQNDSNQAVAMHYHGIHQKNNPWMDGVAFGTQCGIPPGMSMTYDFVVNQNPGVYTWHGHFVATEGDGLGGPFIVDPAEPVDNGLPTEERIVEFLDWYHIEMRRGAEGLGYTPGEPGGMIPTLWPGNQQSVLINGMAQFDCASKNLLGDSYDSPYFCDKEGGGMYTLDVEPGKRYLLRLINLAVLNCLTVTIGDHDMIIVAADGHEVKPIVVKSLDINVAERYDVILDTTQGKPGETYDFKVGIKFRFSNSGQGPGEEAKAGPISLAQVVYGTEPSATKPGPIMPYGLEPEDRTAGWDGDSALEGIDLDYWDARWVKGLNPMPDDMQGEPDYHFTLRGLNLYDRLPLQVSRSVWPTNNNIYSVDPSGMPILPLWATGKGDPSHMEESNNVWKVPKGSVVDFAIEMFPITWIPILGQMDQHPWHLHGYTFYILGFGTGNYPGYKAASEAGLLNTVDPPYRDVMTVFPGVMPDGSEGVNMIEEPQITKKEPWRQNITGPEVSTGCTMADTREACVNARNRAYGWSLMRVKADNPGVWNFHCHILWHLVMSMQGQFIVGEPEDIDPMTKEYAQHMKESCAWQGADTKMINEVLEAAGHGDLVDDGASAPPASGTPKPETAPEAPASGGTPEPETLPETGGDGTTEEADASVLSDTSAAATPVVAAAFIATASAAVMMF